MIKHLIVILALSIAMLLFMGYTHQLVQLLITGHDYIADLLKEVFSGGQTGNLLRELIALLAIPFIIGLIPAFLFWIIRRRWLSWFMCIVWFVWLIQAGAMAILYKVG